MTDGEDSDHENDASAQGPSSKTKIKPGKKTELASEKPAIVAKSTKAKKPAESKGVRKGEAKVTVAKRTILSDDDDDDDGPTETRNRVEVEAQVDAKGKGKMKGRSDNMDNDGSSHKLGSTSKRKMNAAATPNLDQDSSDSDAPLAMVAKNRKPASRSTNRKDPPPRPESKISDRATEEPSKPSKRVRQNRKNLPEEHGQSDTIERGRKKRSEATVTSNGVNEEGLQDEERDIPVPKKVAKKETASESKSRTKVEKKPYVAVSFKTLFLS